MHELSQLLEAAQKEKKDMFLFTFQVRFFFFPYEYHFLLFLFFIVLCKCLIAKTEFRRGRVSRNFKLALGFRSITPNWTRFPKRRWFHEIHSWCNCIWHHHSRPSRPNLARTFKSIRSARMRIYCVERLAHFNGGRRFRRYIIKNSIHTQNYLF